MSASSEGCRCLHGSHFVRGPGVRELLQGNLDLTDLLPGLGDEVAEQSNLAQELLPYQEVGQIQAHG
jgi:hypothetical protein